jgi:hypothetical protein
MDNDVTPNALRLGPVPEAEFHRVVDPVPTSLRQLHD